MLRGDGTVTGRRRAGTHLLVVHRAERTGPSRPARVGFVVSRAVGNSVVRHRVVRRLRALAAERLASLAPSTDLVVRANPPAATASSAELAEALDRALARACRADR
ncbi:ribonuclease P protein component [Ornithinimicrobium cavernae]|uniref:ribonuclease P protein component n=1 Tax=Ornithinimicrobium cavernae TaxID=2666047 RepID=UPI003B012468